MQALRHVLSPPAVLLLVPCAAAQMSGTYTIDPAGTGSRNFTTFDAAALQLQAAGVNGPVELRVAKGTYYEKREFRPVPGASATNTVTLRSPTPGAARMEADGRSRLIVLGDWYVLDGFHFVPKGAPVEGAFVRGTSVECRNCTFESCTLFFQGNEARIHHNLFSRIDTAIGLICERAAGARIHHNEFRRIGRVEVFRVVRDGAPPARTLVYDNLMWGGPAYFGEIRGAVDFVHNTVVVHAGSERVFDAAISVVSGFVSDAPKVIDNILVNFNEGLALGVQAPANSAAYFEVHHNLYFAPSHPSGFQFEFRVTNGAATRYSSLAQWKTATAQEAGSVYGDPLFLDATTRPGDLDLKPTSPAIGAAGGTPAYVTDDFAGNARRTPSSIGAYEARPATSFVPYGKGCAGTFGNVPVIGYGGDLKLGSTTFRVTLTNALGGTNVPVFFAVGAAQVQINFGGACNLLVTPDIVLGMTVGGASGPGNGTASVKMVLPNDPKLRGMKGYFQWGVVDRAAAGLGVAFSDAAVLIL